MFSQYFRDTMTDTTLETRIRDKVRLPVAVPCGRKPIAAGLFGARD